jgi:ubiquinone/menaquinone biosynthesis C-methylase UbiE
LCQKLTFTLVLQTAIKVLTICIAEKAMAVSDYSAFANMERGGWSDTARASGYVKLFASASDQAIGSLLDAVGAQRNFKSLDLCCGQGNVSEALLSRGCEVVGIDFSPAMLAFARGRAPKATFIEGDAQALPFDDAEFDIVVSNLGVCHVPDQPRTLAEARRVLRPGGKFAMTVWCGPDTSPCFAAVYGAIKTHGHPDVSAPLGPDFHQFARRNVAVKLLSEAGYSNIDVTTLDCAWNLNAPEDLFEIYAKGTVRAAMLLNSQPPQNLAAIRSALALSVRKQFANGDRWRVPVPAALIRATA